MAGLREAYEKRKEDHARKKHPAWSFKDRLTVTLSILAFIVSVTNTYYSLWRKQDEISVVVQYPPFAVRTKKERMEVPNTEFDLVFLNSGNQPAAILAAQVAYTQQRLKPGEECDFDNSARIQTDFKPVVVKPNDVVAVKVRAVEGAWYTNFDIVQEKNSSFSFPVKNENLDKAEFPVDICFTGLVSTPNHYRFVRTSSIYTYWVRGQSFAEGRVGGRPFELLREWSLSFRIWD